MRRNHSPEWRNGQTQGVLLLGEVLLLDGRDAEGQACLRGGLAINRNDPLLHGNLATALWRQGRSTEAESPGREAGRLGMASPPAP